MARTRRGALEIAVVMAVVIAGGMLSARTAHAAGATITHGLYVHSDRSMAVRTRLAAPQDGQYGEVLCWLDGGRGRFNGQVSYRWFLILFNSGGINPRIIGFISALAIVNQPRVPRCVHNKAWPQHLAPPGTDVPQWTPPIWPPTPSSPGPSEPGPGPSAPGPGPAGPAPSISVSQGGAYGCAGCSALDVAVHNFPTGTFTYTCHDNSGPGGSDAAFYSHAVTVTDPNQSSWPGVFCFNSPPFVTYLEMAGVGSNSVQFGGGAPPPPPPPPPAPTWAETTGGVAHTWTNYTNAGGYQGPSIPSNATVQIACKLGGFRVADGNTWWYRIASSPWNSAYYVSADAFYNNGQTSGSLLGTPFVDPAVRDC